jgi:hypothetical protein
MEPVPANVDENARRWRLRRNLRARDPVEYSGQEQQAR